MNAQSEPSKGERHLPRATYRLQLNHKFTFNDARRIIPYLAQLGVSHVYASPILKARPGSMHGYDVVEHGVLNPELGTRAEFDVLVAELHAHGLGLIVDIVPNHLGIMGEDNQWWLDVLENGPAARFAAYFDIDWRPNRASLQDRVLVPILGEFYGTVLEQGELQVRFDAARGSFYVRYYDHRFPIDPREYPKIFAGRMAALEATLPAEDPDRADLESLLTAFSHLPARNATSEEAVAIRYRDKEAHKRRLARLVERSPQVAQFIEESVTTLNGASGEPESFNALDALLEAQAYRLSYWRVAVDEINYRRFFDVNDLAALRMNERPVFDVTHQFIFELIEQGAIDGLRIDHSDGLYDPQKYFEWLQQRFGANENHPRPLYVVTEKILAVHERLPESWKVQGTTGYEFAALSTGWLVCADNEAVMTRRYRQFTENDAGFDEIVCNTKKLVMRTALAAEIAVLATQLDRIAQSDRHTSDFTRAGMREAIIETIAAFPVYRTYVSHRGVSEEDRRVVNWAINVARKRSAIEGAVFDYLRNVLLGDAANGRPEAQRQAMMEFAMKFQQVTSPVTAKGVEDTAFYRYSRLVCLNEVGGDPRRFSVSNTALHQENSERAKLWPHAMLATSTHDTKRSEDVRARIAVLSEIPERWKLHLGRWTRLNRSRRKIVEGRAAPDREDEYLIYQTLIGMWAADCGDELIERLKAYVVKAARESKRVTSWLSPNAEYEAALQNFVQQLLENADRNAFLKDCSALAGDVAYFGALNSLTQTALKLTVPGVPDLYQGTERPAFALVDPDNRRPVDYDAAEAELHALASSDGQLPDATSPSAKLFVTWKLLQLRLQHADLFAHGDYQPVTIEGERKDHAIAFIRECASQRVLALLPRWCARLTNGVPRLPVGAEMWTDTRLVLPAAIEAADVFSGRRIASAAENEGHVLRVGDVLSTFPVAVLVSKDEAQRTQ
jgi:(1->4)-alpha-D-glucan 1-alpha-D-glucosylmutase